MRLDRGIGFMKTVAILSTLAVFLGVSVKQAVALDKGATLFISPSHETHNIGEVFSVTLYVSSLGVPMNAVEGEVKFSNKTLELVNAVKIGSVFSVWIEEPFFSNEDGVVRFSGGLSAPGFTGAGGRLLSLSFKAIAEGNASIAWDKASALANDGHGTNILTNMQNADFIILGNSVSLQTNSGTPKNGIEYQIGSLPADFIFILVIGVIGITYIVSRLKFREKNVKRELDHLKNKLGKDITKVSEDMMRQDINGSLQDAREDMKKLKDDFDEEIEEMNKTLT